jgi:hypothetical protein
MYSENPLKDGALFLRAAVTNQIARFPLYLELAGGSGRGSGPEPSQKAAAYFRRCLSDLLDQLDLSGAEASSILEGKRILEYGPGDALGVALLLYAHGADSVECVDRFPRHTHSEKAVGIYQAILDGLDPVRRARAARAFKQGGNPASGFREEAIEYRVTPDGLSGRRSIYDLIVSRAVLALVNRLDRTIEDIATGLRPGGLSVHKVDLSSHGLDRYRPLDFLSWPESLYRLMYSRKGRPNRWRVDKYRELVERAGLTCKKLEPTGQVGAGEVEGLLPSLPSPFRSVPPELLSWLGFWMVLEATPAS